MPELSSRGGKCETGEVLGRRVEVGLTVWQDRKAGQICSCFQSPGSSRQVPCYYQLPLKCPSLLRGRPRSLNAMLSSSANTWAGTTLGTRTGSAGHPTFPPRYCSMLGSLLPSTLLTCCFIFVSCCSSAPLLSPFCPSV